MQPLVEVRPYRSEVVTHSHDFHQVVLPLTGELRMVIGAHEGAVSSKSVALVAANLSHSFTGTDGNSFLVIDIPTRTGNASDSLDTQLWEQAQRHPFVDIDAELLPLIEYIAGASQRGRLTRPCSHPCLCAYVECGVRAIRSGGTWKLAARASHHCGLHRRSP